MKELKTSVINLFKELKKYLKDNWKKWLIAGSGALAFFLAGIGLEKLLNKNKEKK